MSFEDLPDASQSKIEEIENKCGLTREEVLEKYDEIFNSNLVAPAPSENVRHIWTSVKLHSNFFSKPPLEERNLVPCGIEAVGQFGKEAPAHQKLFAYDMDSEKIIDIQADKNTIPLVQEITLGEYYPNMKVSTTERGNLGMDDRIEELPEPESFMGDGDDNPESIDDLLTNYVNIKELTMADLGNTKLLSKRTPKNAQGRDFAVTTDWRCIRNIIILGTNEMATPIDGIKKARLVFTDGSVSEDFTTNKGIIVSNRMSAWIDERFFLPDSSLAHIWGTIEINRWKQPDPEKPDEEILRQNFQMQGYYVLPLGYGPEDQE